MKARLQHVESHTDTIKTFWFQPEGPVHFLPGQFTELHLPHPGVDERGDRHWFTISSSPTESLIGLTTKFANDLSSSYKRELLQLQSGAIVRLTDPMGDFTPPKSLDVPLVFVAGGMGITPVRSIAKFLIDTGQRRPVRLLYCARTETDLVFTDIFEAAGFDVTLFVTQSQESWHGETGTLTADRILDLTDPLDTRTLFFLSGPEPLVEDLQKGLIAKGIVSDRIATDFFPGYAKD